MSRRMIDLQTGRGLFDIVSHGRRGPGARDRLSREDVAAISRTVRRVPEVMVKISGGGTSVKAVVAHLKYIDRHGKLDLETDDGERLQGRGVEKTLAEDWDLELDEQQAASRSQGRSGSRATKLVHNVVLSMPAGVSPQKVLAAAQGFAREEFALRHRYAMVLHTDQAHPHVHLVVKAMGEDGRRLNVRKATLRDWRERFAEQLRDQGIEANATHRAARGRSGRTPPDPVFRTRERGVNRVPSPTVATGQFWQRDSRLLTAVSVGYRALAERLRSEGDRDLANVTDNFAEQIASERDRERQPSRTR